MNYICPCIWWDWNLFLAFVRPLKRLDKLLKWALSNCCQNQLLRSQTCEMCFFQAQLNLFNNCCHKLLLQWALGMVTSSGGTAKAENDSGSIPWGISSLPPSDTQWCNSSADTKCLWKSTHFCPSWNLSCFFPKCDYLLKQAVLTLDFSSLCALSPEVCGVYFTEKNTDGV